MATHASSLGEISILSVNLVIVTPPFQSAHLAGWKTGVTKLNAQTKEGFPRDSMRSRVGNSNP
jgi:hypothetical protein